MKKLLSILRPVALLGIGLMMAVLSAVVSIASPGLGADNLLAAAQRLQTTSPTPAQANVSTVVSTDGIVLMGIVIVLIVIIPILLRRKSWAK